MKNYTIDMIQAMTETDAAAIALEKLDVKGHTVYLAVSYTHLTLPTICSV